MFGHVSATGRAAATAGLAAALLAGWGAEASAQSKCGRITTVAAGETVEALARRCGVTVADLVSRNARLDPGAPLEAGIQLLLPVEGAAAPAPADPAPGAPAPPAVHVVAAGETLSGIAAESGATTGELLALNPSIQDANLVQVGQRIRLPGAADTAAGPPAAAEPDAPAAQGPPTEDLPTRLPSEVGRDPGDPPPGVRAQRERYQGDARVQVTPRRGVVGSGITVRATGFQPDERVVIGIGPRESQLELLARARANPRGVVSERVSLPDWLHADTTYVISVAADDRPDRVVSAPITLRGATGAMRQPQQPDQRLVNVEGTLTGSSVQCQMLRDDRGRTWSLIGDDLAGFRAGERVRVRGTVPRMSVCTNGTALEVSLIERILTDPAQATPGQPVRLTGTLEEGAECALLRTAQGVRYAVAGDLGGLTWGQTITVEATPAEGDAVCGDGTPTLQLRRIIQR